MENEDWSYILDQRELKAWKRKKAAYLTVRRCADRDYEGLLTRLFHQNYRNGAACTFVRDLEAPERLTEGQKYGFYSIFPAGEENEKLNYLWKACE